MVVGVVVDKVGFDSCVDDLTNVVGKSLGDKSCGTRVRVRGDEACGVLVTAAVDVTTQVKIGDDKVVKVSGVVLVACVVADPWSNVVCETVAKHNLVMVAGVVTTLAKFDYITAARGVIGKISRDAYLDALSSTHGKSLSVKTCRMLVMAAGDVTTRAKIGEDEVVKVVIGKIGFDAYVVADPRTTCHARPRPSTAW